MREPSAPIPNRGAPRDTGPVADIKVATAPKIYFEKEDSSPFWSTAMVTLCRWFFIRVMFFLFMRQLQAGGGKAMSFGKCGRGS